MTRVIRRARLQWYNGRCSFRGQLERGLLSVTETPAIGLFSAICYPLTFVRSISHMCWSNQPNSPAKFSFKHIPWCVKLTSTTLLARLVLYCLNTFTLERYIQLAKSGPEGLARALRPLAAVTHAASHRSVRMMFSNDGQVNRKSGGIASLPGRTIYVSCKSH